MSTVARTVYLNQIEPASLFLRVPAQMETWLDVTFVEQTGSPATTDMAAQLQLTSRSGDRTQSYAMPAIDQVNGKARAVIPGGDLTDMNGYRLLIMGTWRQHPALLAVGGVNLTASAGVDAQPDDVIDQIALSFVRGADDFVDVKLWHDSQKLNPYDITTLTVTAPLLTAYNGGALGAFTVTVIDFNEVRLSLTGAQIAALPDRCWWNLIVSSGGGQQTLAQGPVTVTG